MAATQMIDYDEMATLLGGRRFSITDATELAQLIQQGLRHFYAAHDWSFLYKTATLAVTADEADTDLPSDFSQLTDAFSYEPDEYRSSPVQVESHTIREYRAAHDYTNAPCYFAITTDPFDDEVGERWKVMWYPRPEEDYTLYYRYRAVPTIPGTGEVMRGDPRFSLAQLYCVYAAAESNLDIHDGQYAAMRDQALATAIEQDSARFAGTVIGCLAESQHQEEIIHSTWTE